MKRSLRLLCAVLCVSILLSNFQGVAFAGELPENLPAVTEAAGDTAPDKGTPNEGAPDEGAPDEGTPDEGTPDEGTPDEKDPADPEENGGETGKEDTDAVSYDAAELLAMTDEELCALLNAALTDEEVSAALLDCLCTSGEDVQAALLERLLSESCAEAFQLWLEGLADVRAEAFLALFAAAVPLDDPTGGDGDGEEEPEPIVPQPIPVSVTVRWNDNANDESTRPAWDGFKGSLQVKRSVEDADGVVTVDYIPLPEDAEYTETSASAGTVFCELDDVDENGNPYTYTIVLTDTLPAGYLADETDSGITYVQTTSFDVKIQTINGAKTENGQFPDVVAGLSPIPISLQQGGAAVNAAGAWGGLDAASGIGTYTFTGIRKYDDNGNELEYTASMAAGTMTIGGDPYAVTYDNTEVPNHGSETAFASDGGTVKLTLKDTTDFKAYKYWLDDNIPDGRPTAGFTLWRYTDMKNGSTSYRTASPVLLNGTQISTVIDGKTADIRTEMAWDNLDKYNADGYEYVYFLRETMTGGSAVYEQVFNPDVVENGEMAESITERPRADGSDKSIYDDEAIANRISETISVTAEKTWNAAAYIDQIGGVEVTMVLMQRPKTEDNSGTWTATDTEQTQSGFSSATPTKEFTASVPRYDPLGRELEYQWEEISVSEGGGNLLGANGFSLALNDQNSWDDRVDNINGYDIPRQNTEYFTSVSAGNSVVNQLVGEVDYVVRKVWKDKDGNIIDAPEGAEVTIKISNNAGYPQKVIALNGEEDTPWIGHVTDLPKYTPGGALVEYTVREVSKTDGFSPNVSNDATNRITVVTNQPQGGFSIPIQKEWIDDSDSGCRYPAYVEVWYDGDDTTGPVNITQTYNRPYGVLSASNSWFTTYGIPKEFCGEKREDFPDRWNSANYSIREVALGRSAADGYSVTANAYGGDGDESVTTDHHMYVTSYNEGGATPCVTNRRVGTVDIEVTKVWNDKGADITERPDAILTLSLVNGNGVSLTPSTGNIDDGYTDGNVTAAGVKSVDLPTIIPVDKTVDAGVSVTYRFEGLPKYDNQGKVISYSVAESWVDPGDAAAKDYVISATGNYIPENTPASAEDNTEEIDLQQLSVSNGRQGEKVVVFYKEWNDDYAANQGNRPDIYVNLYSTSQLDDEGNMIDDGTRSTEPTPNSLGFKSNEWTADTGDGKNDPNRYWMVSFGSQPKYSGDGTLITYYGAEFTNGTVTQFDYKNPGFSAPTATADDGNTVMQEGGTFDNGIKASVKLIGKKVWQNIPDGFTGELPTITVGLQRSVEGVAGVETLDVKLEQMSTPKGQTSMQFSFYHEDNLDTNDTHYDCAPEKYDDQGRLYLYSFDETIECTSRTDGIDLNDLVIGGTDSNMVITNTFPSNNYRAKLTVSKEWDNRPNDLDDALDMYPSTTFELHRVYIDTDGAQTDTTVGSVTMSADNWKDPNAKVEFSDLLIFAPDGFKFVYYVSEISVDGYTYVEDITENVTAYTQDETLEKQSAFTFNHNPAAKTTVVEGKGTITNTYEPDTFDLEGIKVWDDQSNTFSTRPELDDAQKALNLALYRYAEAQPGQNNAIANAQDPIELEDAEVTWAQGTNANQWKFTYAGLDVWAPNGMPWKYIVKESVSDDYAVNYSDDKTWSTATAVGSENGVKQTVSAGIQTNALPQSIQVKKIWEDEDYNIRPEVTFALQVKLGADGWSYASETAPFSTATAPTDLTGWQYSHSAAGTESSFLSPKWTKMPAQVKVGDDWVDVEYRFVEVQIGTHVLFDAAHKADSLADPVNYAAASNGQYLPSADTAAGVTSAVKNTLQGGYSTLDVEKVWNDQNNAYGIRPASVTFTIECSTDNGTTWETFNDNDGKACTVDVASNGGWTNTVTHLPKYADDGSVCQYRAAENTVPKGYTHTPATDDTHTAADGAYSSTITNTMVAVDIKGTKTWVLESGKTLSLNETEGLVSLTLKQNNKTITYHGGTADNPSTQPSWTVENGKYTFEYTGLPKYDTAGNEYVYTFVEKTVPGYIGSQTGNDITNTVTALTLDKIDAYTNAALYDDDLELSVKDSKNAVVAKWTRAENAANATFTVVASTGSYANLRTANDVLYGLPAGTYTISESGTPADYQTAADVKVTIGAGTVAGSAGSVTVADTPKPTKITFRKYDAVSGGLFGGAEFTLTKADDANFEKKLTSADGNYSLDGLTPGTYTLEETTHPTGYPGTNTDNFFKCTFTIVFADKNSTIDLNSTCTKVSLVSGKWYNDGDTKDGVANYPNRIDIPVKKVWSDGDDRDRIRPGSVTVSLLADGATPDATLTNVTSLTLDNDSGTNGWEDSFENLPEYKNGTEIAYTVTETAVANYTVSYTGTKAGYTVTNTHTPYTVTIQGSKTWSDTNNQDGKRPTSITVNLLANGVKVQSKTVTATNGWKWSFTDFKNDAGVAITYTVTEDTVTDYSTSVTGYNVTNSHELETRDISVSKEWSDDNNRDNIRTSSVTVKLFADGTDTGKSVTLNDGNGWTDSFEDLTKYRQGAVGVEVQYTVEETAVTGYTPTVSGDMVNGYTVTNTHDPEKITIPVTKSWQDSNNQDNKRPSSVTVVLVVDGVESTKTVELNTGNGWTASFTGLDKYKQGEVGTIVQYTIKEVSVDGYTCVTTGDMSGYTVTNTHELETRDISVSKEWSDDDNRDNIRTSSVTVKLFADGTDTGKSVTLNDGNGWTDSFEDLTKYRQGAVGVEVQYTVQETAVTGYTPTVSGDMVNGYTVTNTHDPYTVDIEGSKTWEDGNDQDGVRPGSITVNLLADGTKVQTKTVTEADGWKWKFTAVKNDAGNAITYTITEDTVEDYSTEVNGYNVTNTHEVTTITLDVSKDWEDAENQDGKRPGSITIRLVADGVETDKTLTLDDDCDWKGSFEKLDKYKNAAEIVYTITEDAVAEYTTDITGSAEDGFVVTNEHTPETVDIGEVKLWNDNSDELGNRPDEVIVHLYANGTEVATQTVTETDGWAWNFPDMPKYSAGNLIQYTVGVSPIDGYDTEIRNEVDGNGNDLPYSFVIENTPRKITIHVTKVWDDVSNRDNLRPENITVTLYADDAELAALVLDEDGGWVGEFADLDDYRNGEKIVYTVTESPVNEYTMQLSGNETDGFTFTNSYVPYDMRPKTGDGSKPVLWLSAMVGSAAAAVALAAGEKKKGRHSKKQESKEQ